MVKGVTSSGFSFTIPDNLMTDFRFLKTYAKMKNGDEDEQLNGALDLISIVFSDEAEEERFYKHLAGDKGGRIPVSEVFREVGEIITIATAEDKAVKNS